MQKYPCIVLTLVALAAQFATTLLATGEPTPPAAPRALIATGWDSPNSREFKKYLRDFERTPFDGTVIKPTRRIGPDRVENANYAFSSAHWETSEFLEMIADLKSTAPARPLENFILINANPGNVDWADDAGWAEVADHWRQLARVARAGGMKGLAFDPEPYEKPFHQFKPASASSPNQPPLADLLALARKRGRQVMEAIESEYPGITVLCYRVISDAWGQNRSLPDDEWLQQNTYGLLPAFVDGWLDVVRSDVTIIDGNEDSYLYSRASDYDQAFTRLTLGAPNFFSPEHRDKLRVHFRVGQAIYLDAYVNPPDSNWRVELGGGTPARQLLSNTIAALHATDRYVWVYGQQARWWPRADASGPMWNTRYPWMEETLLRASKQVESARRITAHPGTPNRLANASFADTGAGIPKAWQFWQSKERSTDGECTVLPDGRGGLQIAITQTQNGALVQTVSVTPGKYYAISAHVATSGCGFAGILIRWQTANGEWTATRNERMLDISESPGPGAARIHAGLVQVPAQAHRLSFQLIVRGQVGDRAAAVLSHPVVAEAEITERE